MDRRVYKGLEGIRSMIRERYETWATAEDDLEEVIDAGSRLSRSSSPEAADVRAGPRSNRGTTESGRSETARSFALRGSGRAWRPSKAPGCPSSSQK